MKPIIILAGIFFVSCVGVASGDDGTLLLGQAQDGISSLPHELDYISLMDNLRAFGVAVEQADEVEQPFMDLPGRMIRVDAEDVQVFQYPHTEAVEKQAAQISADGSAIGTSKPFWLASPHFFKKGKLLVLYIGENRKVLKALASALGPQFAGK